MEICQDIFTISILVFVKCHLQIDTDDKTKEFAIARGANYPFMIDFTYILGTDYDPTHTNFGFSDEYPADMDTDMIQQNGVKVTGGFDDPPDITMLANAMQRGIYQGNLEITNDETEFDALIALATLTGPVEQKKDLVFIGVLEYNQGV